MTFLEDINNVLTSGEVPNLFTKDELGGVCEDVRASAKKDGVKADTQDQLYSYFLSRVIRNLHIVLCMSPIGEGFRERCRMFPGLVNCCTIDWFTEWPRGRAPRGCYETDGGGEEHEPGGKGQPLLGVCLDPLVHGAEIGRDARGAQA